MKLLKPFDIIEDKIRKYLSRWPVVYALLGIVGIVLTWRGIWHLADEFALNSWSSLAVGVLILLSTGLLVAIAIGDEVIINAFRGRKKITEARLEETLTLADRVEEVKKLLDKIDRRLDAIKNEEIKIEKEIIETTKK